MVADERRIGGHLDDDALDVPDEGPGGVDGLHVDRDGPSSDPSPPHSLLLVGLAGESGGVRQGKAGAEGRRRVLQRWNAARGRVGGGEEMIAPGFIAPRRPIRLPPRSRGPRMRRDDD
jgi:hypothetical protein